MKLFSRIGSYTVETALVLPMLTAILSGVCDYGLYFNQQIAVITAAREGARVGSTTRQSDGPTAAAVDEAESRVEGSLGAYDHTVTASLVGSAPNQIIRVTVSVPFDPFLGLVTVPDALYAQMEVRMGDQP